MEVDQEQMYGVKVSIISAMDLDDFNQITKAIKELGYEITLSENGNVICEKIKK